MNRNPTHRLLLRSIIGLLSGIVSTGPMTAAMISLHRRLPRAERYPLPPREITSKLARVTGLSTQMSADQRSVATLLAHFGYGAAAGALFGALPIDSKVSRPITGLVFGFLVWAASYLGLLPAAGILSSATEHPKRRSLLMIAAHVVWGATLGAFFRVLEQEANGASQPFTSAFQPHHDLQKASA